MTPMFMVVEAKLPQNIGNVQFCGVAYAVFNTREEAQQFQTQNNLTSITVIQEI